MMLLNLLGRIDRSRFHPYVISLTGEGEIGTLIRKHGIEVEALHMRSNSPNPVKFLRLVKRLRALQPDVVHTWMAHADLLGGVAARLAGIRAISWSLHASNLSARFYSRTTFLVIRANALLSSWIPKKVLSCSERARAVHQTLGYDPRKMVVIPNGVDLRRFDLDAGARSSVRAELGLPPETRLVGLIARYDPQKNHLGFVEAAARIHRVLPEAHFLLAGDGVDRANDELAAAIEQAGMSDRFHLLGRRDDIPRLLAALDVLASASLGEAFPVVLIEAMACGVPCVVTDAGDSADIVGDSGRIVACDDMAGLAGHVVDLLNQPGDGRYATGQKARERVREHYAIGRIVDCYQEFYLDLLK